MVVAQITVGVILVKVVNPANVKYFPNQGFICVDLFADYRIPVEFSPSWMRLVANDDLTALREQWPFALYGLPSDVGDVEDTVGTVQEMMIFGVTLKAGLSCKCVFPQED